MILNENSVVASIVRACFYDFVKEFWETIIAEPFVDARHVKVLCDELQELAERVFKGEKRLYDLIINIPPGSSKSTICSQMFCAWVWTRMAHAQFICTSYSYPIALKDSLKTRDVVQSEKYQDCFGIQLREDANTKGLFVNTNKGYRYCAGIGGAITGLHGHFLPIDDPLNPEQSYSEAELKVVNRWLRTTLPSRRLIKDVSPIILIQQRLAKEDPTGEMLERYAGNKLRHICLPGELTEDVNPPELREIYSEDGLLDPNRMSREVLKDQEAELGAYGYAAQILQNPVPQEGGTIETKKLNLMDECTGRIIRRCRSWDKAGTQGAGKYSAGVDIGVDDQGRYWILDVERGRWNATNRERKMMETADKDGKNKQILIEVEGGSGGKESGENSVRNLAGHHVTLIHPTGDKAARAYPFSSQVGGGNVYVLKRHWTKEYVEELKYFPFGRYSDQTDATSQGFNHIARKKRKVGAMW